MAESRLPTLDAGRREAAELMVDRVFSLFEDWSGALLRFAADNQAPPATYERTVRQSRSPWPEAVTAADQ